MDETENSGSEEPITKTEESENSKGGGTTPPNAQKEAVQCWLAEFNNLRNELLNFQQMQHSLIWVNISVIGAVVTVYFTYLRQENFLVFLAIPIVSGLLGLYWVAQGRQTVKAGRYIYQHIRPALQRLCQDEEVMVWEEFIRREIETTFPKYVIDILSLRVPRAVAGLTFALPSFIAVVVIATDFRSGLIQSESWQVAIIWWLGLILTIGLIIAGLKLGQYWKAAVPRKDNEAT